jgi:hypothetical protein
MTTLTSMPIRMTVNGKPISVRWIDGPTTRDLIALLPVTLTMSDLFKREKFGSLPRALSKAGKETRRYAVGEIAYWSPGPDIAVFYRHDGETIPEPGLIVLGKVTAGLHAFDVPGAVVVHFELLDQDRADDPPPISQNLSGAQP